MICSILIYHKIKAQLPQTILIYHKNNQYRALILWYIKSVLFRINGFILLFNKMINDMFYFDIPQNGARLPQTILIYHKNNQYRALILWYNKSVLFRINGFIFVVKQNGL